MTALLKPVSKKAHITQAQADAAVRKYKSLHGIAYRSGIKRNAKAPA